MYIFQENKNIKFFFCNSFPLIIQVLKEQKFLSDLSVDWIPAAFNTKHNSSSDMVAHVVSEYETADISNDELPAQLREALAQVKIPLTIKTRTVSSNIKGLEHLEETIIKNINILCLISEEEVGVLTWTRFYSG